MPHDGEAEPKADIGGVTFGYHIVTLIDFLGQKDKLVNWDFRPITEDDMQKFIPPMQQTYGLIRRWRDFFEKNFKLWLDGLEPPDWTASLPDGGERYREFSDISVKFMHFSDTIAIYSPIVNRFDHANVSTVLAHLYTTGTLMQAALGSGAVFRGGIEIGMAGPIDEASIYGSVLALAHDLESRVAEYPRIMIGDHLNEYLAAVVADREDSPYVRANRRTAILSQSLIGLDLDERNILDYMGDGFVAIATEQDKLQPLRKKATQFVTKERKRFHASGNKKLAARYDRMYDYFQSRTSKLHGE